MNLAPLLDSAPAISTHGVAALAATGIGVVQFAAPKGTIPHRLLGWIWVVLMAAVALSSFFINEIRVLGPWSPIHLLSIYVLLMLPLAVRSARRHHVKGHRNAMVWLFIGPLVLTGLFTLLPGRIMHAVVFGS